MFDRSPYKIPVQLVLLYILFFPFQTYSQEKVVDDSIFAHYAKAGQVDKTARSSYLVTTWKQSIPPHVKVMRLFSSRVAILSSDEMTNLPSGSIVRMAAADPAWKLSPTAATQISRKKRSIEKFTVAGSNLYELLTVLKKDFPALSILQTDPPSRSAVIQCPADYVTKLLDLPELIFLDLPARPHTEIGIIGYDRSFHGINTLAYFIPGANGKNIVVGVKEQKMEAADLDLYKRVLPSTIEAPAVENHATVIASIIGGAGNSFYDGSGIAGACRFFPSSFANLYADDISVLNAAKLSVQNHSYGTIIQQFYGVEALSYDAQAWTNKDLLHVFSAGNKGTDAAADGPYANLPGSANLTGNFKMAKNVITVGAVDNKGNIPAESSAGPLYDGRIAPQLAALGPNGTSDAAAIVSGTAAVLQQVYADSNNQSLPPAALVKAVLYNTADDIFTTGIDYKTGYGLVNSYEAVKAIQQKRYTNASVTPLQQWTTTINVPPDIAQCKITLAWTDTAAMLNNLHALTNDLDLELTELSTGTVYRPWVLSTSANKDSLAKEAVRKRDSLNTAEQISIRMPAAGSYEIRITGTRILAASIPFSIAYSFDTLHTFHFTSPQHAADVNRDEDPELSIRWTAHVADTNETGHLYISYNQGESWELISPSQKLSARLYRWPVRDTASVATLKMETAFGNFFSRDFIISKVLRPQVDFVCADSFRLSWKKHVYANGYKVYALIDSPYLKPIITVSDTFVVVNRAQQASLVFAVEPLLLNNLPAARSIALNIELQGVQCFYRTLNYVLLDNNQMSMQLALSIAAYTDSVFFDRVTSNGQLLQNFGGAKANSSQLVYTQLADNLPAGTIYIRGRIRLRSGAIVYTDIIPVLSSGPEIIVFYPNPANRHEPLRYALKQGVAPDSRLIIYDVWGRVVKNYEALPVTIDLSGFAPGVFIFKLMSTQNNLLESGKIIVR